MHNYFTFCSSLYVTPSLSFLLFDKHDVNSSTWHWALRSNAIPNSLGTKPSIRNQRFDNCGEVPILDGWTPHALKAKSLFRFTSWKNPRFHPHLNPGIIFFNKFLSFFFFQFTNLIFNLCYIKKKVCFFFYFYFCVF